MSKQNRGKGPIPSGLPTETCFVDRKGDLEMPEKPKVEQWMREAAAEILVGKGRCPVCRWPLADKMENGCVLGNCSDRSESTRLERHQARDAYERAVQSIANKFASHAPTPALEPTAEVLIPEDQRKPIDDLVQRFSEALREKLLKSEFKYGWRNGWLLQDWADDLRRKIREHLEKGDPRDVAAYCAFAWHHGWSLAAPAAAQGAPDGMGTCDIGSHTNYGIKHERREKCVNWLPSSPVSRHSVSTPGGAEGSKDGTSERGDKE